jgi:hypothetical protein
MSPVYFSWKQLGIHVLLTYFSILLRLIFSLTTNVITQGVCPLVLHIIISISTIFQLYQDSQFYWWRKQEYPGKTTDMSQVIDKLYHIILYWVHLTMSEILTYAISAYHH